MAFKKGFSSVKKEIKRQEEEAEKRKSGLWRFFLVIPKGETSAEADLRFLTEEPINFYEHVLDNGRGGFDNHICTADEDNCKFCDAGNKPSFKGAFLVYDKSTYINKDGEEVESGLRMFVMGTKVLGQLDRLSNKYGLTSRDYTIVKTGKGQQVSYSFEIGENKSKLTSKEITNMLPEALRDKYDGTMDSLYEILTDALQSQIDTDKANFNLDDEDEEDDNDNIVDIEDDEEPKKPSKFKSKFSKAKHRLVKPKKKEGNKTTISKKDSCKDSKKKKQKKTSVRDLYKK